MAAPGTAYQVRQASWDAHQIRNILAQTPAESLPFLAMETGELAEALLTADGADGKTHLGEEIADCAIIIDWVVSRAGIVLSDEDYHRPLQSFTWAQFMAQSGSLAAAVEEGHEPVMYDAAALCMTILTAWASGRGLPNLAALCWEKVVADGARFRKTRT